MRAGSKPSKARRKASRLRRMVIHDEAGLEAVEDELFEQGARVAFRHAPFAVVIGDIERIERPARDSAPCRRDRGRGVRRGGSETISVIAVV